MKDRASWYALAQDVLSIKQQLNQILNNQDVIMSALDDLKARVAELETKADTLQTTIDTDQASDAQVAAALTAANEEIAALQAIIAGGITAVEAEEVNTRLGGVGTKLDAAIADVAGPNT